MAVDAMMTRRGPRYAAAVLAAIVTVAAGSAEIASSSDPHADLIVFVLAIAAGASAGAVIAWLGRRGVGGTTTADGKWRWAVLVGPLTVPVWGHALGASGGAGLVGAVGALLTVMFFAAARSTPSAGAPSRRASG